MEWNELHGMIAAAFCILIGDWHAADLKIAAVAATSFQYSEHARAITGTY